jgi:hypothetical protein
MSHRSIEQCGIECGIFLDAGLQEKGAVKAHDLENSILFYI